MKCENATPEVAKPQASEPHIVPPIPEPVLLHTKDGITSPAKPQASEPPELSDKDGWLYDPDAKLAEIRAGMAKPQPESVSSAGIPNAKWIPTSEQDAEFLKKYKTQDTPPTAEEIVTFCMVMAPRLNADEKFDEVRQALAAAFARGRKAGLEEAADIAALWSDSHSCTSHDNNPCCHVRTGVEIERRIRALAGEPASKEGDK